MFPSYTLLSLIFIAWTVVDANPVRRGTGKAKVTFVTKLSHHGHGTLDVVKKDRARAQAMIHRGRHGKRSTDSANGTTTGLLDTFVVGVGSSPTDYTLVINTGTTNTWIGAGQQYVKTSTCQDTGHTISVKYGTAECAGEGYTDIVTLAPDLVISQQSIGVASSSSGFSGYDGILGLGPVNLTRDTVSDVNTVPTVMDNLFSQGTISNEMFGIFYVHIQLPRMMATYASLTMTGVASDYWGIGQSIDYGYDTILPTTSGIVDSGTVLVHIASDAFKQYQSKTGATLDKETNLLTITSDQYQKLQPLIFNIGGTHFMLSPDTQIWSRSLNTQIGGKSDAIYLVVQDIGTTSWGTEIGFIIGYKFLEPYYAVYDTGNQAVGFASTNYTFAQLN